LEPELARNLDHPVRRVLAAVAHRRSAPARARYGGALEAHEPSRNACSITAGTRLTAEKSRAIERDEFAGLGMLGRQPGL
jgi:hypothetical protein